MPPPKGCVFTRGGINAAMAGPRSSGILHSSTTCCCSTAGSLTSAQLARIKCSCTKKLYARKGYPDRLLLLLDLVVSIVRRRKGTKGFKVQHRRWVVERTFGWFTRWRRLNRNYEHTLSSSRAVVQVALIGIMARRLAKTYK